VYGGWRDGGAIPRNEWVHVALTYDGNVANTYINGATTGSYWAQGRIKATANPIRIGMRELTGYPSYFHGKIHDVRVWSKALTHEEIQESVLNFPPSASETLIAHWSLSEGTGNVIHDGSAFANDGVLGSSTDTEEIDPTWDVDIPGSTNSPPSKPLVELIPPSPTSAQSVICLATGSIDADGDAVSYSYDWYINGSVVNAVTSNILDSSYTRKGDNLECHVTPKDATSSGPTAVASARVRNSTPTTPVVCILPERPRPKDGLAVWLKEPSTDADGDLVLYLFEWYEMDKDGIWNRRPELSGSYPPNYDRGEPEISNLYTQIGEAWRVDVSTLEVEGGETSFKKEPKGTSGGIRMIETVSAVPVPILPDLNDDGIVDDSDYLSLIEIKGLKVEDLPVSLRSHFREPGAQGSGPAFSPRELLHLSPFGWK
jgi:hypothetical protein